MLSSINAAILLICIGFFSWRSYKKGLWKALLGLAGFIGAYLIGFIAAPQLGYLVSEQGIKGIAYFMGAMLAIFIVSSTVISSVPPLIFPKLREVTFNQKIGGAALGALTGVVFAVLLIWFVGVAGSMLNPKADVKSAPDVLSQMSSKVVSKAISSGIAVLEKDRYRASATSAFLSAPQTFTQSFQTLSESKKLRSFWQDGRAQFYMGQGDIEQLMREPAFTQLVNDPAMQQILQDAKPKDSSSEQAKEYFAKQVSFVWRRMRTLRSDPRAVEILEDPDVKKLVRQQNPMSMLTNEKIQSLIAIVLEQPLEENMTAAQATLEEFSEQVDQAQKKVEKQVIYKWLDEEGDLQYTDLESTPEYLRESAEKIIR
ncbi:MAG: CvpA family protein [Agarilytica sp.]